MILDKARMAHQWAVARLSSGIGFMTSEIVEDSWKYADAMQAEADKRIVKLPDVFFESNPSEEWQPDLSNIPKDAIAYRIVDGIVQYLHGTISSDGTLCGGYLANDGWIKLENRP